MSEKSRVPTILLALTIFTVTASSSPLLAKGGNPCQTARPTATLAGPDEPGDRLIVTGTVYRSDGATPAAGAIVYAYQTDRTGEYRRKLGGPPQLQGWARTDSAGRYEMKTIRPGAYPSRSTPAHIHFQLWDGGLPQQWTRELRFEDDSLVAASEKSESAAAGRFAWVVSPKRDASGVLRATFDLKSKATADRFEEVTWGLDACK